MGHEVWGQELSKPTAQAVLSTLTRLELLEALGGRGWLFINS